MSISVIVPVLNGLRYLPAFFHSLADALPSNTQLIFVDDGSTEPVLENLPEFPTVTEVVILRNRETAGYFVSVNRGFGVCTGDFVVQLNSDLILEPACISSMLTLLQSKPKAGIVGSKLLFPTTQLVQHIGMAFGEYSKRHIYYQLPAEHPLCCKTRPMQIVMGATVAMTRHVLETIGRLDERYWNSKGDLDHCLRAVRHGFVNYTCAESIAYHWLNQSGPSRFARIWEADAAFWSTWQGQYRVDLGDFVAEAIQGLVEREPYLATLDLEALNLCRVGDEAVLFHEVQKVWPKAIATVHQYRQVSNDDTRYWLPMLLPFWIQSNPKPFIYLVDHFQQLNENRLWFQNRLRLVREEVIVDVTGCAITASEFLSMRTTR